MICAHPKCNRIGRYQPQICVPAKDLPIKGFQPLTAMIGLYLCKKHKHLFTASSFFDAPLPNGMGTQRAAFEALARGRRPPDFSRAFVRWVDSESPEAKKYSAAIKGVNGPNIPVPAAV